MKIRIVLLVFAIWTNYSAIAQRKIPTTDSICIFGEVINPTTFTLDDLDTCSKTNIKDQIMYNQNGEVKDTLIGMIGVPIKALLNSIKYLYNKPKDLNEFYFIFIASDGYKVVFSWNEIYNTEIGNNFFIITEMEGKKLNKLDQRIMFISIADLIAGRRYIKGLSLIEVRRVE